MEELDEIIGTLMLKAEKCIDDGNCWVRYDDFSEIADKIKVINEKIANIPANIQQLLQPENGKRRCLVVYCSAYGNGFCTDNSKCRGVSVSG